MTETERNQIKGALLKCAEENENKFILTGHIVVSSLCKSAVERIAELEKENAELKANNQFLNNLIREKEQRGLEIQEDLLRENEKLKKQVENRNCSNCRLNKTGCPNDGSCHNFSLWQPFINPKLTKAKELIKRLYDIVCGKSGDDWELIEKAEQFIKE